MRSLRDRRRWRLLVAVVLALGALALQWGGSPRAAPAERAGQDDYSLRFYGNGVNDIDRVKIQIDDPANSDPGPPADIGATDLTLEFWMKARVSENTASAVTCGWNLNWIYGNILFDRDRYNQDRKYGVSIAGGVIVFGVSGDGTGDRTICGATNVLDEQWHHVAVQRRRSDGRMWLYVDGGLEAQGDGPDGDISYPDDGVPGPYCGGPCINSDPYLVVGAEKHDAGPAYPSYSGWLDEVRLSNVLRYTTDFAVPEQPFVPDANTAALYHLDEGAGNTIGDSSAAVGGPSDGVRRYGGSPAGPVWSTDTPFTAQTFAVAAAPSRRAVDAGDAVTYTLSLDPVGGFSGVVQLSSSSPSPSLTVKVVPDSVTPPGQATLVITDTHSGPLVPGLWYTIPISAASNGITQTVGVQLLVGGPRIHLPLVRRTDWR